jgi:hypothetical protein
VSATDLAAVLVAIAAVVCLVVLLAVVQSLLRTTRELRTVLERMHLESRRLVGEMHRSVLQAEAEVERVDGLIDAAASIQHSVDGASRLTYLAFSNPLIKVVAVARGLVRGTSRVFGGAGRRRRRVEARRHERNARRLGREVA